ncbi:hypothetical protein LWF01_04105 [Saxibacter everestensis]|uniref:Integral membrane protein n=1 Tax=Saxibacter everestensis TaxID=2909229 RepID=A0ABY8QVJ6_9MICO|nr:hypothetical protein LWF01_04105 [Brevibacteriaceae bacterium ZFBP1038]
MGSVGNGYGALRSGPGRLLIAVYGILALSATARASVQLIRSFDEAPLAYSLSAIAAVVYIVATVSMVRASRVSHHVAVAACTIELIGVLVVGVLSIVDPAAFQHPTVWSLFGIGYGFVPLVLPVFGLLWLRKVSRTAANSPA